MHPASVFVLKRTAPAGSGCDGISAHSSDICQLRWQESNQHVPVFKCGKKASVAGMFVRIQLVSLAQFHPPSAIRHPHLERQDLYVFGKIEGIRNEGRGHAMLQSGDQIRLTAGSETHTFRALTGCLPLRPLPRTEPELQAQLELAAQYWEQSTDHGPEGVLLADLARNFMAKGEPA